MRHFKRVIGVDFIDMLDSRHNVLMAFQFVREKPAWFTTLALQQAAKEAHRRLLVAPPLHQNINRVTALIDRAPEIVLCTLNRDHRFIKVPGIAQAALSLFSVVAHTPGQTSGTIVGRFHT